MGALTAELAQHTNLQDSNAADILVIRTRGPRKPIDWQSLQGKADPSPTSSSFARQCVEAWRLRHGARLGLAGGKRSLTGRRPKKSFNQVHKAVLAAAAAAPRMQVGLTTRDVPTLSSKFSMTALQSQAKATSNHYQDTKREHRFKQKTLKDKTMARVETRRL